MAAAATYRVVVRGVAADKTVQQVAATLATMFRQPTEKLVAPLQARKFVVRRGLDLRNALRYELALAQAGCACAVEPEEPPPPAAPAWLQRTAAVLEAPALRRVRAYWRLAPPRLRVALLAVAALACGGSLLGALLAQRGASAPPPAAPPAAQRVAGVALGELRGMAVNLFLERVQQRKVGAGCEAYQGVHVQSVQPGTLSAAPGRAPLPAVIARLGFACVNMALGGAPRPATRWMAFGYDRTTGRTRCLTLGDERAVRGSALHCGFHAL